MVANSFPALMKRRLMIIEAGMLVHSHGRGKRQRGSPNDMLGPLFRNARGCQCLENIFDFKTNLTTQFHRLHCFHHRMFAQCRLGYELALLGFGATCS